MWGKRFFFALKIGLICVLTICAYRFLSRGQIVHSRLEIIWLLIFVLLSVSARYFNFVERPIPPSNYSWIKLFVLFVIASTMICPSGSLYLSTFLLSLPLFDPVTTEKRAAILVLLISITLLMMYLHYSILSYNEEEFKDAIREYSSDNIVPKKYKKHHILAFFSVLLVCVLIYYAHISTKSELLSIAIINPSFAVPVGVDIPLRIDGHYSGGKHLLVSHPKYGTTYSTSDSTIASVSDKGVLRGLNAGEVLIQVKNGNYEASRSFDIVVKDGSSDAGCHNGVQPFVALAFFIAAFTRTSACARRKYIARLHE